MRGLNHTHGIDFAGQVSYCYFHYFCFVLFYFFFSFWVFLLFVFVCSFASSVSLSTCTNKLPLTFYLQIHDELKLTSPCRIVAPSSKGLQRLFSICCYTHLICLLSGLPIFTKVPPSTRYASTAFYLSSSLSSWRFPSSRNKLEKSWNAFASWKD